MTSQHFYKVLLLGSSRKLKSQVVQQFISLDCPNTPESANQMCRMGVSCDFTMQQFKTSKGADVKIQLWDSISKQPQLSPLFARNAAAAILAVESLRELELAREWMRLYSEQVYGFDKKPIFIVTPNASEFSEIVSGLGHQAGYLLDFNNEESLLHCFQEVAEELPNQRKTVQLDLPIFEEIEKTVPSFSHRMASGSTATNDSKGSSFGQKRWEPLSKRPLKDPLLSFHLLNDDEKELVGEEVADKNGRLRKLSAEDIIKESARAPQRSSIVLTRRAASGMKGSKGRNKCGC